MKNIFNRIFDSFFGDGQAWWIEIKTGEPVCTYYFGPFEMSEEADIAKKGYVEDLEHEGAKEVQATVMRCNPPKQLTVYDDHIDDSAPKPKPALSGQEA
ncbi:MAG: DUF1816 domain-containing protein [Leptolyngbya sp. SIO1D8]|nr:DUF1816 domain-containing protein [Leptolyngbya sp. SIO1D8]